MVIQPVRLPRSRHPARRQSRADGIPCRSAATDEVLKVPIYWDYGQRPTNRSLRGFGPCRAGITIRPVVETGRAALTKRVVCAYTT
ncbi:hypothetical protein EVAR_84356_1 [Eumeta japonica]|uniref:Uncharacterized protein n=1 Tax=Eumeta variegata TaxID=151549 RepID=A0A4C1U4J4_EUMVA|nr:hypothetical protein EVAR_84356_1 [Eumeta japonica]